MSTEQQPAPADESYSDDFIREVLRDGLGRGGEDAQVEEDLPGSGAGNE